MPLWLVGLLAGVIPYALRGLGVLVVMVGGWYVGDAAVRVLVTPRLPGPAAVAEKLRAVQDLATARVVVRTIQRGAATEDGLLTSNTDEILCRILVSGDYGFDLASIGPERIRVQPGRITVTLPKPRLLAPGFTVAPAELLDQRSTRWVTDGGTTQLAAIQAARRNALSEAPVRITDLGIDREVRDTTRSALERLLPHLLGDSTLLIKVTFDDEPLPADPTPLVPHGAG